MSQLTNIIIHLPSIDGARYFQTFCDLFSSVDGVLNSEGKLKLKMNSPGEFSPNIAVYSDDCKYPWIEFEGPDIDSFAIGQFVVNQATEPSNAFTKPQRKIISDEVGDYTQLEISGHRLFRLQPEELERRLSGHVAYVDHFGLNVPSTQIKYSKWSSFLKQLSEQTNLYNYPTGQPWNFIIPSNDTEFQTDIKDFDVLRVPKFELVYDDSSTVLELQFDIQTSLSRSELESLLPAPYGFTLDGLDEYFRSVYIDQSWSGMNIRFDLRYLDNEPLGEWGSGEWLVKCGGRVV